MRFKNICYILLILIMFWPLVQAAENRTEIMVDFRVNVAHIEPDLSGNSAKLQQIVDYISSLRSDSTLSVTSVAFCGAASPDGSYDWNTYLAGARLASLEKFIRSKVYIPDSIISRDDSYIPWDYLRNQVLGSSHAFRDSVVSIIDEAPELVSDPANGKLVDRRILRLKHLDNGKVWNELLRPCFGKMRNASAVIITYKADASRVIPVPDLQQASVATAASVEIPGMIETPAAEPERMPRPFTMAVYSNLLFDALAIPNLGAEFYLGKNLSVGANWMYAWWSRDSRHRYWRTYGGDIHARYWFGKSARVKPLSGHHVDVYGQMLTYDFELGGRGYLGDRWTWGAGLAYGYSLPLSRRLNIDFTVGFGYAGGEYKKYHPDEGCYVWESTHRLNWFGPTKAEISLVWLIGTTGKGGAR